VLLFESDRTTPKLPEGTSSPSPLYALSRNEGKRKGGGEKAGRTDQARVRERHGRFASEEKNLQAYPLILNGSREEGGGEGDSFHVILTTSRELRDWRRDRELRGWMPLPHHTQTKEMKRGSSMGVRG